MSGVGMAGVLLTGVISIFVIGPEGRIHSATPWLFAGKEALIPLILAAAVVVSRSTGTPLLNMFIYTPELFDVRRIEQTVAANGEEQAYQSLLANSSWILAGTLVASSVGNFFLSLSFMSSVIRQPGSGTASGLQCRYRQHHLVGLPDHRDPHSGSSCLHHDPPD